MNSSCPVCGSPVEPDAKVCENCGSVLVDDGSPADAATSPSSPTQTPAPGASAGSRSIFGTVLKGLLYFVLFAGVGTGLFFGGRGLALVISHRSGGRGRSVEAIVISGSVITGTGSKVKNATIMVLDSDQRTITDDTGRFSLDSVSREARITVDLPPGFSVEPESIRVRDDAYYAFTVYETITVSGSVSWGGIFRSQEPVDGVRVIGIGENGNKIRTETNAAGRFVLTGVREGSEITFRKFFAGADPRRIVAKSTPVEITMRSWWRWIIWVAITIIGLFSILLGSAMS